MKENEKIRELARGFVFATLHLLRKSNPVEITTRTKPRPEGRGPFVNRNLPKKFRNFTVE